MIKLLFGDCLEVMKELPNRSIDFVLTDPPYGTTRCKWDTIIPFEKMWDQIMRVIRLNGTIALMANEPFTSTLICSNIKNFRYRWTWEKNKPTGFFNAKKQPMRCVEDVCIFYTKLGTYNSQKVEGHRPVNYSTRRNNGSVYGKTTLGYLHGGQTDRYPLNLLKIPIINNDGTSTEGPKLHPTQKPVALMDYLIRTYTNIGDTVLDFAMGSGTTGTACMNTDRNFIGIEKNEKYFEIAKNRIQKK